MSQPNPLTPQEKMEVFLQCLKEIREQLDECICIIDDAFEESEESL